MRFYRINDQIVFADKEFSIGEGLTANTTDGAHEKHVPVISVVDGEVKVQVGSTLHPMLPEHHIEFILLQTNTGIHTKWLKPEDEPVAIFTLQAGETAVAAYEYCNLHGLWKAEV